MAEVYNVSGSSTPGELLVLDRTASSTVKVSTGTPYDPHVIGVVSTRPGFLLGWNTGAQVALTGRVPTKVVPTNGPIRIGDALTSSDVPGHAMKAMKPGMIVGYALEDADATSTIEIFIDVGYWAGATLKTDGTLAVLGEDLLITSPDTASSTVTTVDSWGLTFRGSAWDAASSTAVTRDFTILNDMVTATTSLLAVRSSSGTNVFTIDQTGNIEVMGDLKMLGRLYPSARGALQDQYYIFVDNSSSTNQYISTNADGWQAQTSYDLAERYYSEDALEPGDLVTASPTGEYGVAKATRGAPLMGIVSTKPGFLLGRHATDTYPIALSGRVPTKVTGQNGAIAVGDLLTVSDTPGVAMKATENGYVVGIALEAYDGAEIGRIEVFVSPSWNGSLGAAAGSSDGASGAGVRGFADIAAGSKKVTVAFPSLGAYPNVVASPYGDAGDWWIERVTDVGFDIVMRDALPRDVRFSWRAEASQTGDVLHNSDGTRGAIDPTTGVGPAMGSIAPESEPVADESTADSSTVDDVSVTEPEPEPTPEPAPDPEPAPET
ncbi:hypothetical protein EDM68_03105 [Candidatus Uhrbacteria bacterium]|nr:MAG: hypothetical protein EDM68_03105 [Candidatus Uhrbacteria bacterium]